MRSAREIHFRIAQQFDNARLYAFPPSFSAPRRTAELPLPDGHRVAAALQGSKYSKQLIAIAQDILLHRFRLFSGIVGTGSKLEWRKDYIHGRSTESVYFRRIPYLDFEKAGDHKNIWELNRHQHLVVLAQAWLFTGDSSFVAEIEAELTSWFEQNPFLRGINYTSALEVAFRALSWLWIDHLAGSGLSVAMRNRLRNGMFQHGHFLQANLSTYFSPNTHLLGEGVALHALGLKFPDSGWEQKGAKVVEEERIRQIQADGSHFEQSSFYHVYALDFFLFYYILANRPPQFEQSLRAMATFLESIQGPSALLNFFGDDDGGRLFYPYGDREQFGRATLATCAHLFPQSGYPVSEASDAEQSAWWAGPVSAVNNSRNYATVFPQSGLVSISRGPLHFLIDTGPFGPGGAGHSHSDTLSFTVRYGVQDLLIDPGTFTYIADPVARNEFRGSGFHNTIRIDGRDQAQPVGPFRWIDKPTVKRDAFQEADETVYLDASCMYRGFTHRRRWLLVGEQVLYILDSVDGPEGEHSLEVFWHLGSTAAETMTLLTNAPAQREDSVGWRSRCLGSREESPVVAYRWSAVLPLTIATVLVFNVPSASQILSCTVHADGTQIRVSGFPTVEFPSNSPARIVGT